MEKKPSEGSSETFKREDCGGGFLSLFALDVEAINDCQKPPATEEDGETYLLS
jgi:hypothetical protein